MQFSVHAMVCLLHLIFTEGLVYARYCAKPFICLLLRGLCYPILQTKEVRQRACVLVSWCCCDKCPQTWWFKTAGIYCLAVLEARRSCALLPQAPGGSNIPWLVATALQCLPLWSHCLLLFMHGAFSLCLSPMRTLAIEFRALLDNPG